MVKAKSLENQIWKMFSEIRGTSPEQSKNLFLILFFLKRMSDIFEEEAEKIFQSTGDEDKAWNRPETHNFFVPESARWNHLQKVNYDLGNALCGAFKALDNTNKNIGNVFDSFCEDAELLNKDKNIENMVFRLIQSLSSISMRDSDLEEPKAVAKIFEDVLEKFALDQGRGSGEFLTPSSISRLMVALLEPESGMTVYDPVCKSGNLLVECDRYIKAKNKDSNIKLFGQEMNMNAWRMCKLNLILHGYRNPIIELGDVITEPRFIENEGLMQFHRVISHPPFARGNWGYEAAIMDTRFRYGIPPKGTGDFAYLQHMIASLNKGGKLVMLAPAGMMFRGASEGRIRKGIIQSGLIEAIIALPPGLLYNTGIPLYLIVLNMDKPPERENSILFIAADHEFQRGRPYNSLRNQDIEKIVNAYKKYKDIDRYSRVVSLTEIVKNDFNLGMPRYVDTSPEIKTVNVETAFEKIQEIEGQREKVREQLLASLKKLNMFQ